jgi:hypothetical protein
MLAFLASQQMDKAASYVARGREYESLSDEELSAQWIQEFRKMALDPRDWKQRAVHDDLHAEFELRNKEPPYKLVKQEFDLFLETSAAAIKDLEVEDPDRYAEIGRELAQDIQEFKEQKRS